MNLSRLLVYIAVTAVSTYLIRVIPLVAIQKKIENRFFRSFLYYVPYAVLAAMIMPAVFYATGNLIASTIGFAIAMIFAYNKKLKSISAMLLNFMKKITIPPTCSR